MKNCTTFSFTNPLSIHMTGTGEYVKEQCAHLVDLFDYAEFDELESIRQDNEADRALVYGMQ